MSKKLSQEQIAAFTVVAEFMQERNLRLLELRTNRAFNRFEAAVGEHVDELHFEGQRHVTAASAVEAAFDFGRWETSDAAELASANDGKAF